MAIITKRGMPGLPRRIVSDWLADDDRRAERLLTVLAVILIVALAVSSLAAVDVTLAVIYLLLR